MYLFIDNSGEHFFLELTVNNKSVQVSGKDNETPPAILDRGLKQIKLPLNELLGIAVLVGKGRFTGTRIAVTFANTLAFALSIPVVAVLEKNNWLGLIAKQPAGVYVSAQYSGEAHISGRQPN